MTHPVLEAQLDAYLDGELTADDARELEAHLVQCADCAGFRDERIALRAAIAAHVPPLQAPDALRQRVRAALRVAGGTRSRRRIAAPVVWRSLALAASLAVVAVGSWRLALQRAAGGALTDQVLASHVRSLMPGHLTDVVSSDQHTVKPWFNGKLDFSPPVYDFAGRGFPLIGGPLDYLNGRAGARPLYRRGQHLIHQFLWPAGPGPAGGAPPPSRQGYPLPHSTQPRHA